MKLFTLSLVCLSACTLLADRELEEFEETSGTDSGSGDSVQSAATTTGSGGASTVASSAVSTATAGPGGSTCGLSPVVMPGACPAECTGGCSADVCHIDCGAEQQCKDQILQCPFGWPCEIECGAHQSCEHTSIYCPDDFTCVLRCLGDAGCHDGRVYITTGVFEVTCSAEMESCKDLEVACSENACRAHCFGGSKPKLTCGPACECSPCS